LTLFTLTITRFNIEATKLTKKGLFSSDPNSFFIIHRASENGVFSPIYQSNVVRSKSNPIYAEFTIKEIELCNGDPNRQLKIEVKKFKDNGRKCDLNEGGGCCWHEEGVLLSTFSNHHISPPSKKNTSR
jgi:hypothetical protein